MLLIAGLVLFLIFGLGGGDSRLTDLDILPGDAQAIMSGKVGDIWKTPGFEQGFLQGAQAANPGMPGGAQMMLQGFKDFLPGISPQEVTRMTFIMTTITPFDPNAWIAIQSSVPINREKYLTALKQGGKMKIVDKTVAGKTYQQIMPMQAFPGQKNPAAYLYNDRLMIFGTESEIVKVLERGAKANKTGNVAEALKTHLRC